MDLFPDDIRRFIEAAVESIDQLEILRVLGEDSSRAWDVAGLAAAVHADPPAVAAHAAALHARGLAAAGAGPTYQFGPRTPELGILVARLLELYRERPVSLIRLVYAGAAARAADPLLSFSNAFRLRGG